MQISLIMPTRDRPSKMESLWKSAITTADAPKSLELALYLDEDDEKGITKFKEMKSGQIKAKIGPRMPIERGANMWNEAHEVSTGEICMLCADDVIFRTQGWDTAVLNTFEKYPDKIVYVNGNDLAPNYPRWGTHGFVHRVLTEIVGYFAPPIYFYGVDDYYTYISKAYGRLVFLHDIIIEHMHWQYEKTEEAKKFGADDTAKFRNAHFPTCVQSMNAYKHTNPPKPGYWNDLLKIEKYLQEFYGDEGGVYNKYHERFADDLAAAKEGEAE